MIISPRSAVFAVAIALAFSHAAAAGDWTHFGGDAARTGRAGQTPSSLANVAWHRAPDDSEEFVPFAGPAVLDGVLIANMREYDEFIHVANKLSAFDAATGKRLWQAFVPPDELDSWASPAIDAANSSVLIATGSTLTAAAVATGQIRWELPLPRALVNMSAAISSDLICGGVPANRAFITDYSPYGWASLYAVNVDPYHAACNPYQPGEIVWTAPLNRASGNLPAYRGGRVVVTTAGGAIHCFDAALGGPPLWTASFSESFFGGCAIVGDSVFAASYRFTGSSNNSRLVKVDFATGATRWSTPCERTDTIPNVTSDGRIFVSGGISGFGSQFRVQAFRDNGTSATQLWDTHVATGGALSVGSWTTQPITSDRWLFVGRATADSFYTGNVELLQLDLQRSPADSSFVRSAHAGSGGACAAAGQHLFSIGRDGLFSFGARTLIGPESDILVEVESGDIPIIIFVP